MGSQEHLSFDYMNRFRCIGPECEDSCCNGWRVTLYQEDYEKIRDYHDEKGLHDTFYTTVELAPPENRFPGNYAFLNFTEKSCCPLMEQGWCALQRDKGEAALPRVCATFPRNFYRFTDHVEVHGLLPCPEVVRQCILHPTPPRVEKLNEENLPTHFEEVDCTGSKIEPYKQALPLVCDFTRKILDDPRYRIEEKNYLIFYFYRRIASFCNLDAENDPRPRLLSQIKRLDSPAALDRVMKDYKGMSAWPPQLIELLLGILAMRLQDKRSPRFRDLCSSVLAGYGEVGLRMLERKPLDGDQRISLWRLFLERRNQVQKRFATRVDRYVTNFCVAFWLQDLYMGAHSPLDSACKLAFSLATIRFLFVGHPKVVGRMSSDLPIQEEEPLLDEAIVQVIQIYMKYLGSDASLMTQIMEAMEKTRLNSQDSLAAFLMV